MPRSSLRQFIGALIGELVISLLMGLGLISFCVIALTGFDVLAAAQFTENVANRMVQADGERARAYQIFSHGLVIVAAIAIFVVRQIDRRFVRRGQGKTAL